MSARRSEERAEDGRPWARGEAAARASAWPTCLADVTGPGSILQRGIFIIRNLFWEIRLLGCCGIPLYSTSRSARTREAEMSIACPRRIAPKPRIAVGPDRRRL